MEVKSWLALLTGRGGITRWLVRVVTTLISTNRVAPQSSALIVALILITLVAILICLLIAHGDLTLIAIESLEFWVWILCSNASLPPCN